MRPNTKNNTTGKISLIWCTSWVEMNVYHQILANFLPYLKILINMHYPQFHTMTGQMDENVKLWSIISGLTKHLYNLKEYKNHLNLSEVCLKREVKEISLTFDRPEPHDFRKLLSDDEMTKRESLLNYIVEKDLVNCAKEQLEQHQKDFLTNHQMALIIMREINFLLQMALISMREINFSLDGHSAKHNESWNSICILSREFQYSIEKNEKIINILKVENKMLLEINSIMTTEISAHSEQEEYIRRLKQYVENFETESCTHRWKKRKL